MFCRRLMHWKETGGVEKLFALPGRLLHSQPLFKHYQKNLTAKPAEDENVSNLVQYICPKTSGHREKLHFSN